MKLFLIHSFGTNAKILNGLKLSFDRYFDTEIIDLPGFSTNTEPLSKFTFELFAEYIQEKISSFDGDFIIGGISFGFGVLARLELGKDKCKGILALEPFLGHKSIKIPEIERLILLPLLDSVEFAHMEKLLFNESILKLIFHLPRYKLKELLNEYDPKTFFESLELILKDNNTQNLLSKDFKYILALNPDENTLNVKYIKDSFMHYQHLFIPITLPHYPNDLSKELFDNHLQDIQVIKDYLGI